MKSYITTDIEAPDLSYSIDNSCDICNKNAILINVYTDQSGIQMCKDCVLEEYEKVEKIIK